MRKRETRDVNKWHILRATTTLLYGYLSRREKVHLNRDIPDFFNPLIKMIKY